MQPVREPRYPVKATLYCSTCDFSFGDANPRHLGVHFVCPEEDHRKHFARVVIDSRTAKSWLRWERRMLYFQNHVSPLPCLQRFFPGMEAGIFACISTIVLLMALIAWPHLSTLHPVLLSLLIKVLLFGLTFWRLVDIFITNISITFTSRFPANPIRSVLLSFIAYIHVILCFAIFYLVWCEQFTMTVSPSSAVFYSFGTIATVGYGDLKPKTPWAESLVVLELVGGLFFVAIIFAQVASWATKSRREEGDYSMDDLR